MNPGSLILPLTGMILLLGGFPLFPVSVCDGTQDAAGGPGGDDVGRDVLCHHGARGNDAVPANGHAGTDHHIPAQPDAVLQGDGQAVFQACVPNLRRDGMSGGLEARPGADEDPVSDGDARHVQENTVVIDEHVVAQGNVGTIVAAEAGLNPAVLS